MQISVLLSVKPRFAQAILDGTKKFEFRRALFRKRGVRKIVLYASTPVQKVVGEFVLDDVLTMEPSALWAVTGEDAGIDRPYFDSYFAGRAEAHALKVTRPRRYEAPLDLREHFGIDRPPQSFCYLAGPAGASRQED
jgi:predicted transcriptional regulator